MLPLLALALFKNSYSEFQRQIFNVVKMHTSNATKKRKIKKASTKGHRLFLYHAKEKEEEGKRKKVEEVWTFLTTTAAAAVEHT